MIKEEPAILLLENNGQQFSRQEVANRADGHPTL
jgi:hypothetical protein